MGVKPAQIELSIDELILDARVAGALTPRALQRLRVEIERELTHLLNAGELPTQLQRSGQVAAVDAGLLSRDHAQAAGNVTHLGAQIAQSVYRSLTQ